jgi:DNA polymerase III alpha subunit
MARLFRGREDAVERTLEIAERCRFSLDELRYEYPEEPVPKGTTPQQRLAELTWQGARERFAKNPSPPLRGEREGPGRGSGREGEVGGACSELGLPPPHPDPLRPQGRRGRNS